MIAHASDPSPNFWYEDTIRSNPITHFGVWTPEGWKTHNKVFAKTVASQFKLKGNGQTLRFGGLPPDAANRIHDGSDPATDGAIYPSEVRIEYPNGRPRWAISHTYLAYPHADQTLYSQEYTVDYQTGDIHTHFRRHIAIEEAFTDDRDGLTARVANRPISTVICGNKSYPLCNSAVRGVWSNPEKKGENFYIREHIRLCHSLNAIYIPVRETPVVQCHGIWRAEPRDLPAFDRDGACIRPDLLKANGVPLDCARLGAVGYLLKTAPSSFYGSDVELVDLPEVTVKADWLSMLRKCQGIPFREHQVGYAAWSCWHHMDHIFGRPGSYAMLWDFNENGEVDAADENLLEKNIGRSVRVNYYTAAYFGNDWLSTGVLLDPEMHIRVPVICAWQQGGGYDAASGTVNLFDSPGPGRKVYVEYHHDEPAMAGPDHIVVTARRLAPSIS